MNLFKIKTWHKPFMIDLIIIASIFAFLLCYFEPTHLFSKTITTGGDTGSHYYTAQYLRDYLLPRGKISGWCQGNLAGFPILQNYFPFPFVIMAVLSWLIPLQISFKLVSVMGIFLLPPFTYLFLRLLRQPFPVPVIGAIFSLPFLFMEGNSMWGGNIPSTLAGTFCYSLGFALAILWLGLLYRAVDEKKGLAGCSILLALVGLCHGYTLLFALFASLFFLFTRDRFGRNLRMLFRIHLVAFGLMAFWLVPLIAFLPYTTRFSILWLFMDWGQTLREVLPSILYPFMGCAIAGALWSLFMHIKARRGLGDGLSNSPQAYVWFGAFCGLVLYGIGYKVGVVDVRFLPFFQFFSVIAGAMVFSRVSLSYRERALTGLIFLFLTVLWVDGQETFIRNWIRSNYSGFEGKQLWESFSCTNRFLKGSTEDPRVVYEHSMLHEGAGTVRAFEALPLFSGRSTLEGVYIQASLSVPFIFYIQSEISQRGSMPIADYNYSRFNLKRAREHLKLFNVRDLVLVEPETKETVIHSPGFHLLHRCEPYEIYVLEGHVNGYVERVRYKPVLSPARDWRRVSYQWFRLGDLSVPVVFKDDVCEEEKARFHVIKKPDMRALPKESLGVSPPLKETVKEEEVFIEGASIGKPLLIRISYHPNWKVEGADQVYLVSPSFMLIYPTSSRVRLYYGRTWPDYAGAVISAMALLFLLLSPFYHYSGDRGRLAHWFDHQGIKVVLAGMVILALATGYYIFRFSSEFPVLSYNKGIEFFTKGDYRKARGYFKEVISRFPQTLIVDQAAFHHAICFFKEEEWDDAIRSLEWLLETYPETGRAGEALYHMGVCYLKSGKLKEARNQFGKIIRDFPRGEWALLARERLKEFAHR